MAPVIVTQGCSPIVLAFPHGGVHVPDEIWSILNENGHILADTDWHIHQLYDGLLPDATTVQAGFHRYVVDANRDPEGGSLYPGQNTTGLCPLTDFDGNAIWKDGHTLGEADINARRSAFHRPYHEALAEQLERIKSIHGRVILYDCHSIRSRIPFLFDGVLPDFNIGTNDQMSCEARIEASVSRDCAASKSYSHVLNGRFKGGWTTRHYANPNRNIHVIQMELALSAYASEEKPWAYDTKRADKLRGVLKTILENLEELALGSLSEKEIQ